MLAELSIEDVSKKNNIKCRSSNEIPYTHEIISYLYCFMY
jgi:hypothetical protein